MSLPFWKMKTLSEMSKDEWETLCDGCGKCCLVKLEDEDTGLRLETDIACKLFDGETCRCKDYRNRKAKVPDCVVLTPQSVLQLPWIPKPAPTASSPRARNSMTGTRWSAATRCRPTRPACQ